MNGVHDMGGMHGMGPIQPEKNGPSSMRNGKAEAMKSRAQWVHGANGTLIRHDSSAS